MQTDKRGELRELYQHQYFVLVTEQFVRVEPVRRDWVGYRHVDTEPEKVSFLVRAALFEVNNACGENKRPKVLGKPKILRFKIKKHLGPMGVELPYLCTPR